MMMNFMDDLRKSKEIGQRRRLKIQDVQDLRNAGVYGSGMDNYYDKHGDPLDDVTIPTWAQNLHRAHKAEAGMRVFNTISQRYVPQKKSKPKVKRSDQMKVLLEEYGVKVLTNNTIEGYEGFQFLPNGRIRTHEKDVISAIQFIHDYV